MSRGAHLLPCSDCTGEKQPPYPWESLSRASGSCHLRGVARRPSTYRSTSLGRPLSPRDRGTLLAGSGSAGQRADGMGRYEQGQGKAKEQVRAGTLVSSVTAERRRRPAPLETPAPHCWRLPRAPQPHRSPASPRSSGSASRAPPPAREHGVAPPPGATHLSHCCTSGRAAGPGAGATWIWNSPATV